MPTNTATAWSALGTEKAMDERLSLGHDVVTTVTVVTAVTR